jgi:hypothetical protein
MTCNCMEKFNGLLAERNTRIQMLITLDKDGLGSTPYIGTEQIEKGRGKMKAVAVQASHCPFCGKRYEEEAALKPEPGHDPFCACCGRAKARDEQSAKTPGFCRKYFDQDDPAAETDCKEFTIVQHGDKRPNYAR